MENNNKTKKIRQQQVKRLVSSLPEFQIQFNLLHENAKSVYNYLTAAWRKQMNCSISQIRIAKAIGIRRETVCRIIKQLQARGLLKSIYRFKKTSIYFLPVLIVSLFSKAIHPEQYNVFKARPRGKLTLYIKEDLNILSLSSLVESLTLRFNPKRDKVNTKPYKIYQKPENETWEDQPPIRGTIATALKRPEPKANYQDSRTTAEKQIRSLDVTLEARKQETVKRTNLEYQANLKVLGLDPATWNPYAATVIEGRKEKEPLKWDRD